MPHQLIELPRGRVLLGALLACLGTAMLAPAVASDVVVIAGSGSGIATLTKDQVADLFLGRSASLPGGGPAALLDQPESSPLRDAFYSKVTGKSAAQAKSTWAKLSFTGKGTPPKESSGNDEIKRQVASNRNMLGYVDKGSVDGSVKIVYAP
jgi:ABC-type phosphate transport system substrate-binding protein